jgi:hypothetical protein
MLGFQPSERVKFTLGSTLIFVVKVGELWHGGRRCHARKPACGAYTIASLCPSFGERPTDKELALKLVKKSSDFR